MSRKPSSKKLVKFHCPKCGDFLAEALPTAKVNCKRCGRWVAHKSSGGAKRKR